MQNIYKVTKIQIKNPHAQNPVQTDKILDVKFKLFANSSLPHRGRSQ